MVYSILIRINMFSGHQIVNFYNEKGECIFNDAIPLSTIVSYIENAYKEHPELNRISLVGGSEIVLKGIERRLKTIEGLNIPIEIYIR